MLSTPTSAPFPLAGRKILVVDDDRLNLRIVSNILKTEGYALAEANSGEAALATYHEFLPNLVLLDVMLPGIDGFTACRELKRIYGDKAAPVIFITAYPERLLTGERPEPTFLITKPFQPEIVKAVISQALFFDAKALAARVRAAE